MAGAMSSGSGLDDKAQADFAWARFRRILWGMGAASLAMSLVVVAFLWWTSGPLPWLFIAFVIFGVFATMILAALLMGLMFLSSGTGHDEQVVDPVSEQVLKELDDA